MNYVEIKTISDIYKYVNKENLYDFLQDFEIWLNVNMNTKVDGIKPVTDSFLWKDDKLHTVNIQIELEDCENIN